MARLETGSLVGMVAGPIVWSAHFLFVYVFLSLACTLGLSDLRALGVNLITLVLLAVTLVALGFVVYRAWLSWRDFREAAALVTSSGLEREEHRQFLGYMSFTLYALSFVAIVWVALPVFVLAPCR